MKYLVICSCGHSMERHDAAGGCSGESGDCICTYTDEGALEAAIAQAKIQPWFTPASSVSPAP
jgi:hypothetical protein